MRQLMVLLCTMATSLHLSALPLVTVQGNQWLQPVEFLGLNWDDIASVCDPATGNCDGTLNGISLSGWTWASNEDMTALFNFYIGSPELTPAITFYSESGDRLISDFLADGWIPDSSSFAPGVSGYTSSTPNRGALIVGNPSTSGVFSVYSFTPPPPPGGIFPQPGSWFFRPESAVPLPATWILVLGGIIGLSVTRPRGGKKLQSKGARDIAIK